MPRSTTRRLLAGIAIGVLVAACSGGSGGAGASSGASAASAPAASSGSAASAPASVQASIPATDGGGDTGSDKDFCTIFPLDKLSQVVGKPVTIGDKDLNETMAGMGCNWKTADHTAGVIVTHVPIHAGFTDIQQTKGQQPISGFPGEATIGPWPFSTDKGLFDATQAAAIVGDGYYTVLVAPRPSDDVVVQLLKDAIATGY